MPRDTLLHLRFDEHDATLQPSDAKGNLADATGIATLPTLVDGFSGYARQIDEGEAMQALDIVAGSTLATRDITVQAIVRWDFDGAISSGWTVGTIYQRGSGDGTAAQAISCAVQLRVVNASQRIAEVRFVWHDTAGTTLATQLGGHFVVPSSSSTGWLMITATRHWISTTEVELQYYVGSTLVGEHFSADGNIGGGTNGVTYVGVGPSGGGTDRWFLGPIDELRVLNYHVTQEEVEATWLRLSQWQPDSYAMVRQLLPPDAPISDAPTSRIQRLLKGIGHALGYANAQADNLRRNLMPDRAYGPVLERWETITGEAPRALDTTKQRRRRVVSHFQQRQGVSPPGVRAAIKDQLQLLPEQIPLYAFANDFTDSFTSVGIDSRTWWLPNGSVVFAPSGSTVRFNLVAGADLRVLNGGLGPWHAMLAPLGGNGRDAHIIAKIVPTTIGLTSEVGVCFYNFQRSELLMLGIRNNGGVYEVVREEFARGALQGVTVLGTVALPGTYYLHMFHRPQLDSFYANVGVDPITGAAISDGGKIHRDDYINAGFGTDVIDALFTFQWGTSYTELNEYVDPGFHRARYQWAGFYARSNSASSGAIDVVFDDVVIRSRYGDRPFRWYGYRDPALPGSYDLPSAQATAQRLAHAHTFARVVNSISAKCEDATTTCDSTPIGGF